MTSALPHQVLARGGDGPMPAYRICALAVLRGAPATAPRTPTGNRTGIVLAAFDGRDSWADAPEPTGIHLRRSVDGGRTWGPLQDVHPADRRRREWSTDPSLVVDDETGTVHLFHTVARDRGVWDAVAGTDDADRDALSSMVSTSRDGGETWVRRSLTAVAQAAPVRAAFATSGAGVRLRSPAHAGRLVQPYAGWWGPDDEVRSFALLSDDHGRTWRRGRPTGSRMDETTIAELSDGTLLLDSRDHARSGVRRRSLSEDGGETWRHLGPTTAIPDPGNNAQLARVWPEASPLDPRSRVLALSSTPDASARRRGTLSLSLDDGATWASALVFAPGPCEYSVVAPLDERTLGVMWEVDAEEIRFARVDLADLAPALPTSLLRS